MYQEIQVLQFQANSAHSPKHYSRTKPALLYGHGHVRYFLHVVFRIALNLVHSQSEAFKNWECPQRVSLRLGVQFAEIICSRSKD